MTSKEYIAEFIKALELQLEKKKSKPQKIAILDLELKGKPLGSSWLYKIRLEKFISLEDLELKLQIGDQEFECNLLQSSPPNEIGVSVRKQLHIIPGKMFLYYPDTQLLEALIRRCKSIVDYNRFGVPERIFNGNPVVKSENDKTLPHELNPYQRAAVLASYGGDCMIWGPPGTGKTQTIAAAMELHLRAGNRSILLSHANAAVDGAFKRLAKTLKDTDTYRDGRMIRMGACDDALLREYPLISLENVAEDKAVPIRNELELLRKSLEERHSRRASLNQIVTAIDQTQQAKQNGVLATEKVAEFKRLQNDLAQQIKPAKLNLERLQQELEQANRSWFKRLFGKSPEELAKDIQNLENEIGYSQAQFDNAIENEKQALKNRADCITAIKEAEKVVATLLEQLGVTEETFNKQIEIVEVAIKDTEGKIEALENKINNLKKEIIENAVIVGTTLTTAYLSDDLWNKPFECAFVDEVSMAPLPQLFLALSLASKQCTLIGDFLQLPPIEANVSKDKDKEGLAHKWLDQSIFQITGLNDVRVCLNTPYVTPLKTQYRMNPAIAEVVNELFYGGMLEHGNNTKGNIYLDPWSGESPLVLLDTSHANPHAIKGKGTTNTYHAAVASHLAVSYLTQDPKVIVGIATQYRRQADNIREMVRSQSAEKGFGMERVIINTIHSFQGGECDVIIYDSVESLGSAKNPWLMKEQNPSIELLLNVAVTRAISKFILLVNKDYAQKKFGEQEPFRKVLDLVETGGECVDSTTIDPCFKDVQDEMLKDAIAKRTEIGHYNEETFWGCFLKDLETAQNRIVIFCPYLAEKRINMLEAHLLRSISRQVEIILITKEIEEHKECYQVIVKELLNQLSKYPINVKQKKWMHHKIILIDDSIVWEGSMNILSTYYTGEQMVRVNNAVVVKNLSESVGLTELLQIPNAGFFNTSIIGS